MAGSARGGRWAAGAAMATIAMALTLSVQPVVAAEPVTTWHVPVLMYHRVAPDSDLRGSIRDLVVRPRLFRAHMRALHEQGWTTITAASLASAMRARVVVPHKTVVISFDDGTQDVYTNAWPIMRRLGFVGTFYLITSRIREENHPWSYAMSQVQANDLAAQGNEIGNHTRHHACLSGMSAGFGESEIEGGARDITRAVGQRPITLAWPKGCLDATSISAARDSRMYLAFSTMPGCRETLANRLAAPRIRIHRSTSPSALLRLLSPCR